MKLLRVAAPAAADRRCSRRRGRSWTCSEVRRAVALLVPALAQHRLDARHRSRRRRRRICQARGRGCPASAYGRAVVLRPPVGAGGRAGGEVGGDIAGVELQVFRRVCSTRLQLGWPLGVGADIARRRRCPPAACVDEPGTNARACWSGCDRAAAAVAAGQVVERRAAVGGFPDVEGVR